MEIKIRRCAFTGALASGQTGPEPPIDGWLPETGSQRPGLVIFPGGGYGRLAAHEGPEFAEYFARQGVASFVVSYRLGTRGYRHPAMLEDALAGMAAIRSRAAEFGLDPGRIGVMGSSAGGHLAALTMTTWHRYASAVRLRPDFGVLCYPVITAVGRFAQPGSIRQLAGPEAPPERLDDLCCEKQVTSETPPCFLWHTGDDPVVPVENSLLFASALRTHGVPFELHVYPQGAHGLGLSAPYPWTTDCLRWMRSLASCHSARS